MRVDKDPATDLIAGAAALRGMGVQDLSSKSKIPRTTIYKRMRSPSTMTLSELRRIVHVTKMPDDMILQVVKGELK